MDCELVFIIPLKSAKVSADWNRTQEILRNTLTSVNLQPNSRAIVVCNESPQVDAEIVQTDVMVRSTDHSELRNDKMRKCHLGLKFAARYSPKRAMILDADDLLHRDLVHQVSRFDPSIGVIMRNGYRYIIGDSHLRRSFDYHNISASSVVFPYTPDVGRDPSDYYMTRMVHVKPIERAFRAEGIRYRYLRFPAGVYLRGTNDSMRDIDASARRDNPPPRATAKPSKIVRRTRDYFWKAAGKLAGNVRITEQHFTDFPGLNGYSSAAR